eukprot:1890580-Rhodomonas_salina.1
MLLYQVGDRGVSQSASVVSAPVCLRNCYGMSGTDVAYGLRSYYGMSGTDVAYGLAYGLRSCYGMSGSDTAYGAARRMV